MPRDILVLVEHSAGKIDSLSSQLLAIGQRTRGRNESRAGGCGNRTSAGKYR